MRPRVRWRRSSAASSPTAGSWRAWRGRCEVVTFDWENVPAASLKALRRGTRRTRICPPAAALACGQDRVSEKRLFAHLGIPTTRWRAVDSRAALMRAIDAIGLPGVLKTRRLGYDGKGQALVSAPAQAARAWELLGAAPLIYEEWVPFDCEVSIIGARGAGGETVIYPLCGNVHARRHPACDGRAVRCAALAAYGGGLSRARARAFSLPRHPRHRVLRARRPPDRQRDGAARAQLRPLDHRGGADQPVRESPARDPRPAARRRHPRSATAP